MRGGISRQKATRIRWDLSPVRERARAREGRVSPKVETHEGDDIFRFHERRLRNYEERLDDINPRLDSLSFGGKGEFQPGTIRGLLGGS